MIKLILVSLLLFPRFDFFETAGTETPQWKDWTIVDNDEHFCQRNGEHIVCPQSVQQPNAGPGRAYAITCGYIYESPDVDKCLCLAEWEYRQVYIPWLLDKIVRVCTNDYQNSRMLYAFIMFIGEIDTGYFAYQREIQYNGYTYSWWERDPCWGEY